MITVYTRVLGYSLSAVTPFPEAPDVLKYVSPEFVSPFPYFRTMDLYWHVVLATLSTPKTLEVGEEEMSRKPEIEGRCQRCENTV
jgi:hypothetical protein